MLLSLYYMPQSKSNLDFARENWSVKQDSFNLSKFLIAIKQSTEHSSTSNHKHFVSCPVMRARISATISMGSDSSCNEDYDFDSSLFP